MEISPGLQVSRYDFDFHFLNFVSRGTMLKNKHNSKRSNRSTRLKSFFFSNDIFFVLGIISSVSYASSYQP